MADTTIVNLTATTTGADGDLLPVVDVSDTAQSVGGSTRKITLANVKTYMSASPSLVTPALGTPSSGTLTNCTGLPVAGGGTGRATGTTAYALIATGTTATGAQQSLAAGATTEVLVGGGASALPVWTTATGSGAPVRATSPTLTTPVLGVATGTSFNGMTITTTTGTLTLASGKTATISNTLTFTGTDSSTVAFGTGGSVAYANTPVTLSAATDLIRSTHGNRYLICDTAATLTVLDDTAGSWIDGDILYGDNTSAGNVVLAADATGTTNTVTAETGHTLTVAAGRSWSLRRTGANAWRGGALEAAAASSGYTAGYAASGPLFFVEPLEIGSTTWSVVGCGQTTIDTSTVGAVSSAFNTSYGFRRIQYTAAAAAANRGAGIRGGSAGLGWFPGGVRTGNLWFRGAFAAADALTSCRVFCGLKTGGEPTASAEPSTFTDVVFVGADTTDTNLQIMHNDSAGACTKVDLGASFPANSNAVDMYEVTFKFNSGASRSVDYVVTNLVSGTSATGSLTTDLPTAGTTANYAVYRNTGANTTACVLHIMGVKGGSFTGLG